MRPTEGSGATPNNNGNSFSSSQPYGMRHTYSGSAPQAALARNESIDMIGAKRQAAPDQYNRHQMQAHPYNY